LEKRIPEIERRPEKRKIIFTGSAGARGFVETPLYYPHVISTGASPWVYFRLDPSENCSSPNADS